MSRTPTIRQDPTAHHGAHGANGFEQETPSNEYHPQHGSHFWRHFLEMIAVMVVGMIGPVPSSSRP